MQFNLLNNLFNYSSRYRNLFHINVIVCLFNCKKANQQNKGAKNQDTQDKDPTSVTEK